jgi:glycosyltransferase involved in cell wall biosynthesis
MSTIEFMLPFYGSRTYLLETVESVRAQSDPDWTLTILDDDPDAGACDAVRALADPRIEVVRNPARLGLHRNFQAAFDRARADYVVILGSDDRLLPNYLSTMRTAASSGAEMIHPGVRVIDANGAPHLPMADRMKQMMMPHPRALRTYGGQSLMSSLMTGNWAYFPSVCWRTDAVRGRELVAHDIVVDLALMIDVLLDGGRMAIVPDVCFEYRRHGQSVSSLRATVGSRFDEEQAFLDETARRLDAHGWHGAAFAARARLTSRLHSALTAARVRSTDRSAAARLMRAAIS